MQRRARRIDRRQRFGAAAITRPDMKRGDVLQPGDARRIGAARFDRAEGGVGKHRIRGMIVIDARGIAERGPHRRIAEQRAAHCGEQRRFRAHSRSSSHARTSRAFGAGATLKTRKVRLFQITRQSARTSLRARKVTA